MTSYARAFRRLKGRLAALVIADADGFVDARHKDLSVADVAGASGGENRLNHLLRRLIMDHKFDLHLGQKIDRVLTSSIELGVALLATMPTRLQNRHAFHADLDQRLFHCVQPRWLNDRFNLLHACSSDRS